jgi:WD40 repeat protein
VYIDYLTSAVYSPDGRYILTASPDNRATIWDATSGEQVRTLIGHRDDVSSAAYSPDGRTIVTTSNDQTAIIWNAGTGEMIRTLGGHSNALTSAAYSPDGHYIVTVSYDDSAIIWNADYHDFITDACEQVANLADLTRANFVTFGIQDRSATCPQFAGS